MVQFLRECDFACLLLAGTARAPLVGATPVQRALIELDGSSAVVFEGPSKATLKFQADPRLIPHFAYVSSSQAQTPCPFTRQKAIPAEYFSAPYEAG